MIKWIIRFFGIKGSFSWAIRQMKKGETVTRHGIVGTLRFKINDRGTILWCFDSTLNQHKHKGTHRWDPANLDIEYITAADWCLLAENTDLTRKLEYNAQKKIN